MELKDIIRLKEEKGLTAVDIASRSGVPISTVYKILQGQTEKPRKDTLDAIEKALDHPSGEDDILMESTPYYVEGTSPKKRVENWQGEYTIDDYKNWPESERIELINGKVYFMEAPHAGHQFIVTEITANLYNFIRDNKKPCKVFGSPLNVQLDKDDKTIVQPDILILCDEKKFKDGNIFGAPEFVAEVLSPSTGFKDMTLKLHKYKSAGVKEYWIINPRSKTITVYLFEREEVEEYSFEDMVPVALYDGKCKICLKDAGGFIDELYG